MVMPTSIRTSFTISMACAAVVVAASHIFHLQADPVGLAFYLPAGLAALAGANILDYLALRGTPVNKLSKVFHVSAFANLLWLLTVLAGVAADTVFSRPFGTTDYVIVGMLLAVGLRIGIFISVFGAGAGRAVAVSFIQPLIFMFAFLPPSYYDVIASPVGLAFGFAFVALGLVWTVIADRAGRPGVTSTFGLLQVFLTAWTEKRVDEMEEFMESRAHEEVVATKILRFVLADRPSGIDQAAIVLPDIHPGPFGSVGGSNLPFVLYEAFSKNALIMHSISDHSLNIPSKRQLDRYIVGLGDSISAESGGTCTVPVQIKIGKSTATGIAFGSTAVVMLSLAPAGMEDIPQRVRDELESHGSQLGFGNIMVIDCHNAMGKHLNAQDEGDLLSAAKQCLDELKKRPQHDFRVGFASLDDVPHDDQKLAEELGGAGLAVLVVNTGGQNYAIGWADSNNMENRLRDRIVGIARSDGMEALEVCTSDTHSTSGKRTREGYFPLGTTSDPDRVARLYLDMCRKAAAEAEKSAFELVQAQTPIKVMGEKQFEDYSYALDKSMAITKVFIAITSATYIAMLVLVA